MGSSWRQGAGVKGQGLALAGERGGELHLPRACCVTFSKSLALPEPHFLPL